MGLMSPGEDGRSRHRGPGSRELSFHWGDVFLDVLCDFPDDPSRLFPSELHRCVIPTHDPLPRGTNRVPDRNGLRLP